MRETMHDQQESNHQPNSQSWHLHTSLSARVCTLRARASMHFPLMAYNLCSEHSAAVT